MTTNCQDGIKKAACTFCFANCAVLVHIRNGKVTRVEGNPDNRLSRGHICERVAYAPRWLYHSGQLMYPLKRAGNRGEGRWERVTWDEALDDIADKLLDIKENHGAESIVAAEGTYRGGLFWARSRFFSLFGNPQNVTHPGIVCMLNCNAMDMAMVGGICSTVSIGRTNCLVIWGWNPAQSAPRAMAAIRRRKEKDDLAVIVIDPRHTKVADLADTWLQIRPGTDAALGLGWLNVIISEGLFDKEFVSKWTLGFDSLAERAAEYPPHKVSKITGLAEEDIVTSARMYATTKPACIARGVATDQIGRNSSRVEQIRVALRAITGNLDVEGGNPVIGVGPTIKEKNFLREANLELVGRLSVSERRKQLGTETYRLMSWPGYELTSPHFMRVHNEPEPSMHRLGVSPPLVWEAILTNKPYPVKALITWGSNPLLWASNTKRVYQALKSPNLELHVVSDFWLTPTAELADYVLPVAIWLERPLCSTYEDFSEIVYGGERAIPPLGERRDAYSIWRELAIRVGQKEFWPWETYEEVIEYQLSSVGVSYAEFVGRGCLISDVVGRKKYELSGFATSTGKVELYSTVLEKLGYDPLPFYEEPPESPVSAPEVHKDYPLILNTGGRFMPMFHSEHRQLGIGMRERHPDPLVSIHPGTARGLGIKEGDWVWIETRRGRIKQKVQLDSGILPNVVNVEASLWFPELPGNEPSLHGLWESNANVLTLDEPNTLDPLTGGWCNRALLCRVRKVETHEQAQVSIKRAS